MISPISRYNNDTKARWRGWVWNRVKDRLKKPAFKANVLYLAGDGNYDMREAVKRGFKRENLIAVDIDETNVENARKQGCIGICCKVEDALHCWPENFELDAVILDYCCGVNDNVMTVAMQSSLYRCCGSGTTLVMNVQRGRDKARVYQPEGKTERQELLYAAIVTPLLRAMCGKTMLMRTMDELIEWRDYHEAHENTLIDLQMKLDAIMRPDMYSYRAQRVYMDTLLITLPAIGTKLSGRHTTKDGKVMQDVVRKLAAAKAIHTRRQKRR